MKPLDVTDGRLACPRCGTAADLVASAADAEAPEDAWECPACGHGFTERETVPRLRDLAAWHVRMAALERDADLAAFHRRAAAALQGAARHGQLDGRHTMNIQQRLDDWLEQNPEFQKYVERLYYVAPGTTPPADTTHQMTLASTRSAAREITVAAKVLPPYDAIVESLLALVATAPPA